MTANFGTPRKPSAEGADSKDPQSPFTPPRPLLLDTRSSSLTPPATPTAASSKEAKTPLLLSPLSRSPFSFSKKVTESELAFVTKLCQHHLSFAERKLTELLELIAAKTAITIEQFTEFSALLTQLLTALSQFTHLSKTYLSVKDIKNLWINLGKEEKEIKSAIADFVMTQLRFSESFKNKTAKIKDTLATAYLRDKTLKELATDSFEQIWDVILKTYVQAHGFPNNESLEKTAAFAKDPLLAKTLIYQFNQLRDEIWLPVTTELKNEYTGTSVTEILARFNQPTSSMRDSLSDQLATHFQQLMQLRPSSDKNSLKLYLRDLQEYRVCLSNLSRNQTTQEELAIESSAFHKLQTVAAELLSQQQFFIRVMQNISTPGIDEKSVATPRAKLNLKELCDALIKFSESAAHINLPLPVPSTPMSPTSYHSRAFASSSSHHFTFSVTESKRTPPPTTPLEQLRVWQQDYQQRIFKCRSQLLKHISRHSSKPEKTGEELYYFCALLFDLVASISYYYQISGKIEELNKTSRSSDKGKVIDYTFSLILEKTLVELLQDCSPAELKALTHYPTLRSLLHFARHIADNTDSDTHSGLTLHGRAQSDKATAVKVRMGSLEDQLGLLMGAISRIKATHFVTKHFKEVSPEQQQDVINLLLSQGDAPFAWSLFNGHEILNKTPAIKKALEAYKLIPETNRSILCADFKNTFPEFFAESTTETEPRLQQFLDLILEDVTYVQECILKYSLMAVSEEAVATPFSELDLSHVEYAAEITTHMSETPLDIKADPREVFALTNWDQFTATFPEDRNPLLNVFPIIARFSVDSSPLQTAFRQLESVPFTPLPTPAYFPAVFPWQSITEALQTAEKKKSFSAIAMPIIAEHITDIIPPRLTRVATAVDMAKLIKEQEAREALPIQIPEGDRSFSSGKEDDSEEDEDESKDSRITLITPIPSRRPSLAAASAPSSSAVVAPTDKPWDDVVDVVEEDSGDSDKTIIKVMHHKPPTDAQDNPEAKANHSLPTHEEEAATPPLKLDWWHPAYWSQQFNQRRYTALAVLLAVIVFSSTLPPINALILSFLSLQALKLFFCLALFPLIGNFIDRNPKLKAFVERHPFALGFLLVGLIVGTTPLVLAKLLMPVITLSIEWLTTLTHALISAGVFVIVGSLFDKLYRYCFPAAFSNPDTKISSSIVDAPIITPLQHLQKIQELLDFQNCNTAVKCAQNILLAETELSQLKHSSTTPTEALQMHVTTATWLLAQARVFNALISPSTSAAGEELKKLNEDQEYLTYLRANPLLQERHKQLTAMLEPTPTAAISSAIPPAAAAPIDMSSTLSATAAPQNTSTAMTTAAPAL